MAHVGEPSLPHLTQWFLFEQLHPDEDPSTALQLPIISSKVSVFRSAVATFYAPSDDSGIRGMQREHIRSTPSW